MSPAFLLGLVVGGAAGWWWRRRQDAMSIDIAPHVPRRLTRRGRLG